MAILPIDLQAMMLRMDNLARLQQQQQEGVIAAQMVKGEELSQLAQLESSRVNEVRPHPDGNAKIEEKEGQSGSRERKKRKGYKGKEGKSDFEDPYRGTIIDTKR